MQISVRCFNPSEIYNKYVGTYMSVPCGKCSACLSHRASQWQRKLEQESLSSKYTFFVTLTFDEHNLPLVSPDEFACQLPEEKLSDFASAVEIKQSQNILDYYHGAFPHFPLEIFQKFIKRLRKHIYVSKNISPAQRRIRYYAVSEYGPTTFRPHCHALFFFESDWLYLHFEKFVSQAWSTFNKHTRDFLSMGRIDVQAVRNTGACASYVASYLNCYTEYPEVIKKYFPCWQVYSTKPSIGSCAFSYSQVQYIFRGQTVKFTLQKPSTNEHCELFLWRSFEDAFFPKCHGFSLLSHQERVTLYRLSNYFERFNEFLSFICSKWQVFESVPSIQFRYSNFFSVLFRALRIKEELKYAESHGSFSDTFKNALRRLWLVSCRVCRHANDINKSVDDYVYILENYWKRKEYELLKLQLQFEEDYMNSFPTPKLSDLITFVSPLIFDYEKCSLPLFIRSHYLKQFGLSGVSSSWLETDLVMTKKFLLDAFVKEGKNKKIRNEYIQLHPEILRLHYE